MYIGYKRCFEKARNHQMVVGTPICSTPVAVKCGHRRVLAWPPLKAELPPLNPKFVPVYKHVVSPRLTATGESNCRHAPNHTSATRSAGAEHIHTAKLGQALGG